MEVSFSKLDHSGWPTGNGQTYAKTWTYLMLQHWAPMQQVNETVHVCMVYYLSILGAQKLAKEVLPHLVEL